MTIIRNHFNQEFYTTEKEVAKKLNLHLSKKWLFPIMLIYQNAFFFLLLIILVKIKDSAFFLPVFALCTLFNFLLPLTMGRTNREKLAENPAFLCLQLSDFSENQVQKILAISELANFWIHDFGFEFISMWLFMIKFKWLGVFYSILWMIYVSCAFLYSLRKKNNIYFRSNSFISYLFETILTGLFSCMIITIIIAPIHKISLAQFVHSTSLKKFSMNYLSTVLKKMVILLHYPWLYITILIALFSLIIINVIVTHQKKGTKNCINALFRWYQLLNKRLFKNNIFVKRDLQIIRMIFEKLDINSYFLCFPSELIFIMFLCTFYLMKNETSSMILISIDFLFWVATYNFLSILIQKIPIFHLSSELKNVELIHFSSYTLKDLIVSKHLLLALFGLPFLCIALLTKLILLLFYHLPIVEFLLGSINSFLLFATCLFVSLRWTFVLPKFTWTNIFMIRNDQFDTQIIQQFTTIIYRIIFLFLSFSFSFVNITKIHYSTSMVSCYFVLSYLILFLLFLIFVWRKNNEIEIFE
ncbi:MAG: hypothetical protein LBF82_03830 [Lactobacillales bacterium]|jgi:hypothetical protein|nr:hypothetical protein [Lactobacillales bacterium]